MPRDEEESFSSETGAETPSGPSSSHGLSLPDILRRVGRPGAGQSSGSSPTEEFSPFDGRGTLDNFEVHQGLPDAPDDEALPSESRTGQRIQAKGKGDLGQVPEVDWESFAEHMLPASRASFVAPSLLLASPMSHPDDAALPGSTPSGGSKAADASWSSPASGGSADAASLEKMFRTRRQQFHRTQLCAFYQQGRCLRGDKCAFAHTIEEVREQPNLTKTTLCEAWMWRTCPLPKEMCRFAHGRADLRTTQAFWKTSLCKMYTQGRCQLGDKCRYAHGTSELRGD
mmetsp:Transcript_54589/g.130234  ORF Transcript_54589/g.130234 Transcript_54589/m.130234 type:complete len:285 (-) Transcript_54589:138-992(-)